MTNYLLEICSRPYLTSKIRKGNVGYYGYDEATVCRYQNIMDNREGIVYPSRNKQMPFFEPRVWSIRTCPLSMLYTCRTGITYERNLLFKKRCNIYLVLLRWGGGKRSWNLYEIFYRNYSELEPRLEKLLIHLGICQCCN